MNDFFIENASTSYQSEVESRVLGSLVGLAVGDAVGCTVEFRQRGRFEPLKDMVGGGKFSLEAGQWTDDTSMALCSAQSLLDCRGFDPVDHMEKFVSWVDNGYYSCKSKGFGIGKTVIKALGHFYSTREPYSGAKDPKTAGNGSLMRIAPIAMFYYKDSEKLILNAKLASMITHAAPEAIDACVAFVQILRNAYLGSSKSLLLAGITDIKEPKIIEVLTGDFINKGADEIFGSGYVVQSLEAALWSFYNTDSFKEAILLAGNLGEDADTTAAICGQVAGAFYGLNKIPEDWKTTLFFYQEIVELGLKIFRGTKNVI